MKIGILGDIHATKNMRTLQSVWEDSVCKSIVSAYETFDKEKVDRVICLGDFFDKPVIEAKHIHFILPILQYINNKHYMTDMLLGNHEIDDNDHNILDYLNEYIHIHVVSDMTAKDDLLFIPYNVDIMRLDPSIMKGKYVFTHHDIYGSALAGGQTTAFFGVDTDQFKEAKRVFNGHVHLKSTVAKNILNVGSLLVSQQGELIYGELPQYLILDTEKDSIEYYQNHYSPVFLSIHESQIDEAVSNYKDQEKIFRIDYDGEIPDINIDAHVSWRKLIRDIGESTESVISREHNFDFKSYLTNHIKNDSSIIESEKDNYIKVGLEVLG